MWSETHDRLQSASRSWARLLLREQLVMGSRWRIAKMSVRLRPSPPLPLRLSFGFLMQIQSHVVVNLFFSFSYLTKPRMLNNFFPTINLNIYFFPTALNISPRSVFIISC